MKKVPNFLPRPQFGAKLTTTQLVLRRMIKVKYLVVIQATW